MNVIEKEMIEVLKVLKEEYGVIEIKAEFEAEGSRMSELMRLKDVTSAVSLPIILKTGGVEAITDLYNGLQIGVSGIVAPMAETAFAASKFLNAIKNYIPSDNAEDIEFALNIETITAYNNIDSILALPDIGLLSGITIGRVDLVGSMGLNRSSINTSTEVENICTEIFRKARDRGLKTALGGGISVDVLPIVKKLNDQGMINKFETRKVVYSADAYQYGKSALLKGIEFELLWLKSKKRFYSKINQEDDQRILMLEKRLKQ